MLINSVLIGHVLYHYNQNIIYNHPPTTEYIVNTTDIPIVHAW